MKRNKNIKKIALVEERVPIFEKLIEDSKILDSEEKENLIFSIKYIFHIISKYKNRVGVDL